MDRRQYLATSAVITSIPIGGCTALREETSLGTPTKERDSGSVHFVYEHEGEEIVVITFSEQLDDPPIYRFRALIEQPGNTTLDDIRFRFKSNPKSEEPVDIYLYPPRADQNDGINVYRQDGWAVIEASESLNGNGTTGYDVLVYDSTGGTDLLPLVVDYEITLSEEGFPATPSPPEM